MITNHKRGGLREQALLKYIVVKLSSGAAGYFRVSTDSCRNQKKADSKKNCINHHFIYPLYLCLFCSAASAAPCFVYVRSIARGKAQKYHTLRVPEN